MINFGQVNISELYNFIITKSLIIIGIMYQ